MKKFRSKSFQAKPKKKKTAKLPGETELVQKIEEFKRYSQKFQKQSPKWRARVSTERLFSKKRLGGGRNELQQEKLVQKQLQKLTKKPKPTIILDFKPSNITLNDQKPILKTRTPKRPKQLPDLNIAREIRKKSINRAYQSEQPKQSLETKMAEIQNQLRKISLSRERSVSQKRLENATKKVLIDLSQSENSPFSTILLQDTDHPSFSNFASNRTSFASRPSKVKKHDSMTERLSRAMLKRESSFQTPQTARIL